MSNLSGENRMKNHKLENWEEKRLINHKRDKKKNNKPDRDGSNPQIPDQSPREDKERHMKPNDR